MVFSAADLSSWITSLHLYCGSWAILCRIFSILSTKDLSHSLKIFKYRETEGVFFNFFQTYVDRVWCGWSLCVTPRDAWCGVPLLLSSSCALSWPCSVLAKLGSLGCRICKPWLAVQRKRWKVGGRCSVVSVGVWSYVPVPRLKYIETELEHVGRNRCLFYLNVCTNTTINLLQCLF